MKVIIQRTGKANVKVDKQIIGQISHGLTALVGITEADEEKDVETVADKLVHLRIFEDDENKMNKSLIDVQGSVLSISQFTLYADIRKGRRPSFVQAAHPDKAKRLYELFNHKLAEKGIRVETGEFGAMMDVELVNNGPVTIILETIDGKLM